MNSNVVGFLQYSLPKKGAVAKKASQDHTPSYGSGNGSGGGNMLESRVAKLESDVERITVDISEIKSDLKEVSSDVSALKNDISVIKSNNATKEDIASLKADVAVIKSNYATKEDIASVRIELHKSISSQTKWFIGSLFVALGAGLTIAKYLF